MTPATTQTRLERSFDARPDTLWAAWTEPGRYLAWRTPQGADRAASAVDPQEEVVHEQDPPRRLVRGTRDRSFLLDVGFEQDGDRTRLTLVLTGAPPAETAAVAAAWDAALDRLAALLGELEGDLVLTRVFDAAPQAVWRAWTVPEAFRGWWGPPGFTAPVSRIDLRVGGRYLHCMRDPRGNDMWATGEFLEIDPPRRLVMTHVLADADGNEVAHDGMDAPLVMTLTVTLEDLGGRTRMTLRHAGMPPGDGARMAGMGWQGAFEKLAATLG